MYGKRPLVQRLETYVLPQPVNLIMSSVSQSLSIDALLFSQSFIILHFHLYFFISRGIIGIS